MPALGVHCLQRAASASSGFLALATVTAHKAPSMRVSRAVPSARQAQQCELWARHAQAYLIARVYTTIWRAVRAGHAPKIGSSDHVRLVEPPRGATRAVGRRRPSTNFASRRPTARGGSFAELQRTRVLRANLHCVQRCAATRADSPMSARQASIRMFAHARTVGPLTVGRCGRRAAS